MCAAFCFLSFFFFFFFLSFCFSSSVRVIRTIEHTRIFKPTNTRHLLPSKLFSLFHMQAGTCQEVVHDPVVARTIIRGLAEICRLKKHTLKTRAGIFSSTPYPIVENFFIQCLRVLCMCNCARLHEGEGDLTSALTKLVEVNEWMTAGMCWCLCLGVYWDTVYNIIQYKM